VSAWSSPGRCGGFWLAPSWHRASGGINPAYGSRPQPASEGSVVAPSSKRKFAGMPSSLIHASPNTFEAQRFHPESPGVPCPQSLIAQRLAKNRASLDHCADAAGQRADVSFRKRRPGVASPHPSGEPSRQHSLQGGDCVLQSPEALHSDDLRGSCFWLKKARKSIQSRPPPGSRPYTVCRCPHGRLARAAFPSGNEAWSKPCLRTCQIGSHRGMAAGMPCGTTASIWLAHDLPMPWHAASPSGSGGRNAGATASRKEQYTGSLAMPVVCQPEPSHRNACLWPFHACAICAPPGAALSSCHRPVL
jgi:hypothetical protein